MKLLHKTTLYLLLAALPIALGGIFLLNYFIHQEILDEIDELLLTELTQVEEQLRRHPPDAMAPHSWDPNLQIELAATPRPIPPTFTDSTLFDSRENESVVVRFLRATYSVRSRHYVVTLQQSYLEFDEIARALSVGVIVCFLGLIALLLLVDVVVSRRVWQPFYGIIQQLQHYRVDQPEGVHFPSGNVEEFTLLSQSLDAMIQRTRHQYNQQKQFTDNASHEMQTPLSVLSFELDLLQQSAQLTEIDLDRIERSQQTIKRLSAMNQSLLLLAKIDNQQFAHRERVNISELVNQLLDNYLDYAAHKGIVFIRLIEDGLYRSLNRQLADVLFSNLIKNAIRHGNPNSSVLVQVGSHCLIITNEGDPLPFPEEHLFRRFVRNQALPQSTGLGLALVKQIADQYGMIVYYNYSSAMRRHVFQVDF